jgi:hypothetical protein
MSATPSGPTAAQLEAERESIVATLRHIQEIPVSERPADIAQSYGRVREIDRQLYVSDPYKTGYDAEWTRLQEVLPRTMVQFEEILEAHQRRVVPFATAAALQADLKNEAAMNFEYRYHQGAQAAISHWVFEQEPRLKMSRILEDYANGYTEKEVHGKLQMVEIKHMTHELPESVMARNFSQQLAAGNAVIDLSQAYVTGDGEVAQKAHDRALGKLAEMIVEARERGYTVNTGQAHTYAQKHSEVMAVSEGYRV